MCITLPLNKTANELKIKKKKKVREDQTVVFKLHISHYLCESKCRFVERISYPMYFRKFTSFSRIRELLAPQKYLSQTYSAVYNLYYLIPKDVDFNSTRQAFLTMYLSACSFFYITICKHPLYRSYSSVVLCVFDE